MNIINIIDENDDRLTLFYKTDESYLKNLLDYPYGVFICESELVINRALMKGYEPISFLVLESEIDKYKSILNKCNDDIPIYTVNEEIFSKLKGFILIKGILCICKRKKQEDYREIIKDAKRIVVLEDVVNPTNVGAIFRNAAALYVDGVLLSDDSCDPLYRRSVRVSMGNVFNIDYAFIDKNKYIDILHENGFKIVAFALNDNSIEIDDKTLNNEEKLAIILGSEGYGMMEESIMKSDYIVKISMNNNVDSLNVASCSGIALWQLCKGNKKTED